MKISAKFADGDPLKNIPALVRMMAWRRVMRQANVWTNAGWFTETYMRHSAPMS